MRAAGRRRGGARDGERHGGGHRGVPVPPQGRRPCRRRQGAVRLLPLRGRGPAAALRHRLDAGRRHRPRRSGSGRCSTNTKAFFLESPTNPTLEVIDIAAVAEIAHTAGARLIVDNVFATPLLQQPLELGADVVVYSATKHIDGQGRVARRRHPRRRRSSSTDHLHTFLRQTGPSLSPFNAWVLLKGLETLPVRVERQTASGGEARRPPRRPPERSAACSIPAAPTIRRRDIAKRQMTRRLDAGRLRGEGRAQGGASRSPNALKIIRISNNLGDAKSLITHPSTTTHQRLSRGGAAELGITQGLLRLSVGLEDVGRPRATISIRRSTRSARRSC